MTLELIHFQRCWHSWTFRDPINFIFAINFNDRLADSLLEILLPSEKPPSTDLLFLEDRDQTEDSGGELLAVQGGCHHVPGDASVVNDDDPIWRQQLVNIFAEKKCWRWKVRSFWASRPVKRETRWQFFNPYNSRDPYRKQFRNYTHNLVEQME